MAQSARSSVRNKTKVRALSLSFCEISSVSLNYSSNSPKQVEQKTRKKTDGNKAQRIFNKFHAAADKIKL